MTPRPPHEYFYRNEEGIDVLGPAETTSPVYPPAHSERSQDPAAHTPAGNEESRVEDRAARDPLVATGSHSVPDLHERGGREAEVAQDRGTGEQRVPTLEELTRIAEQQRQAEALQKAEETKKLQEAPDEDVVFRIRKKHQVLIMYLDPQENTWMLWMRITDPAKLHDDHVKEVLQEAKEKYPHHRWAATGRITTIQDRHIAEL